MISQRLGAERWPRASHPIGVARTARRAGSPSSPTAVTREK